MNLSIHDNFMYVRNLARCLIRSKAPSLLFKLDIRKAFDSVRWDYILDLLQRRGFSSICWEWIPELFHTSSSRFLLNGVAGPQLSIVEASVRVTRYPLYSSSSPLIHFSKCLTWPLHMDYSTRLGVVVLPSKHHSTRTMQLFLLNRSR